MIGSTGLRFFVSARSGACRFTRRRSRSIRNLVSPRSALGRPPVFNVSTKNIRRCGSSIACQNAAISSFDGTRGSFVLRGMLAMKGAEASSPSRTEVAKKLYAK